MVSGPNVPGPTKQIHMCVFAPVRGTVLIALAPTLIPSRQAVLEKAKQSLLESDVCAWKFHEMSAEHLFHICKSCEASFYRERPNSGVGCREAWVSVELLVVGLDLSTMIGMDVLESMGAPVHRQRSFSPTFP